jgi:hypothetical protein
MSILDPVVLFRPLEEHQKEKVAARKVWKDDYVELRTDIPHQSLVIGRYACLPFYDEVEREAYNRDGMLINANETHREIADMKWVNLVSNTPKTWFDHGYRTVPDTENGWIVKGRTNSRKFQWNDMMYAEDRDGLRGVMNNLRNDQRINDQGLVIREYVPLEEVDEKGINGLPITNEWRFFFLNREDETYEVGSGFYWAITEKADDMGQTPDAARKAARQANLQFHKEDDKSRSFVCVDVARTKEREWTVIELNDGQQSGLSTIDPASFYLNLSRGLTSLF